MLEAYVTDWEEKRRSGLFEEHLCKHWLDLKVPKWTDRGNKIIKDHPNIQYGQMYLDTHIHILLLYVGISWLRAASLLG